MVKCTSVVTDGVADVGDNGVAVIIKPPSVRVVGKVVTEELFPGAGIMAQGACLTGTVGKSLVSNVASIATLERAGIFAAVHGVGIWVNGVFVISGWWWFLAIGSRVLLLENRFGRTEKGGGGRGGGGGWA